MKNRFRIFLSILVLTLAFPLSIYSQEERTRPNRGQQEDHSKLSLEERKERFAQDLVKTIENYVQEMDDLAPTTEQMPDFTRAIGRAKVEQSKILSEFRKARQGKKGRPSREDMMAMANKREKVNSALIKELKGILSKPQLKAFKKAKEKINPKPQRGPGGGGGGGRGPGGGGGGGGR